MKSCISLLFILILSSCQTNRKAIIAHRGLPRLVPEHTLAGIKEAMRYDIDYVEPDIVLTKDHIPIIMHDIHIDTTTNVANIFPKMKRKDGRFYAIDFTFAQIKKLTVNNRKDLKTGKSAFSTRPLLKSSSHTVPSLEEFISVVIAENKKRSKKIGIYPEFKSPSFHKKYNANITKISHDILLKYHSSLDIIIQCFDNKPLIWLKKINSPFKRVQLIADNSWNESDIDYEKMLTEKGIKMISDYAHGIGPWIPMLVDEDLKPNMITTWAHTNNLVVHPYTVRNDQLLPGVKSEKELINLLINKIGVDGLFTDNVNTTTEMMKR